MAALISQALESETFDTSHIASISICKINNIKGKLITCLCAVVLNGRSVCFPIDSCWDEGKGGTWSRVRMHGITCCECLHQENRSSLKTP